MPRKIGPEDPTRLYDNDLMERLSRAAPYEPFVIYLPIAIGLLSYAFIKAPLPKWKVAGMAVAGILFWTLLEYILHRFLFHFPAKSEFGKKLLRAIHGIHHQFPYDDDRLVIPPFFAFWVAVTLGTIYYLLFGFWLGMAFLGGGMLGYLYYDFVHYSTHHRKARFWWEKSQKRRHYIHHYLYPDACFGVTTGFWDWVFGTTEADAKRWLKEGKIPPRPTGNWAIIDNDLGRKKEK